MIEGFGFAARVLLDENGQVVRGAPYDAPFSFSFFMPVPPAVTRQNLQAFPVVSFRVKKKLTTGANRNICW